MAKLTKILLDVMEQAAIAGLCRDGQIEMVIQEARKMSPDLDDRALSRLAETIYKLAQENI